MPQSKQPSTAVPPLVGRERELEAIKLALDLLPRGMRALVLEGEPGIGKTRLWEEALRCAEERACRVLSCRPDESETQLAFAALGDLLAGTPERTLSELPPPQRRALEVALLLAEAGDDPVDQRAVAMGFLSSIRAIALEQPLVVAVDDAQWLDASSAAVLAFAIRRMRDERVALLLTVRNGEDEEAPLGLERSLEAGRLLRLRLAPFTLGALQRLLREALGKPFARPVLQRVLEASGGNPFFALELGRALEEGSLGPAAGEPLPVPATLRTLLLRRVAAITDDARDALVVASLMSSPTVAAVGDAMADGAAAAAGVETAVAAGIIELDRDRIVFSHPLLREAVLGQAPLGRRREFHARLARVVEDVEERAHHVACSTDEADAAIAQTLDEAARRAADRGAPTAAAELGELAMARTPPERELELHRRTLTAAEYHLRSGALPRGRDLLEALVGELPAGGQRADVLLVLAEQGGLDVRKSVELCRQALREAEGDTRRLARIEARIGTFLLDEGRRDVLPHARRAVDHAEHSGDRQLEALCVARLAMWELWAAEPTPGLLERALDAGPPDRVEWIFDRPQVTLAVLRATQGSLDDSRRLLEDELEWWAQRGDERAVIGIRIQLAYVYWRAGAWDLAEAGLATAFELVEQLGLSAADVPVAQAFIAAHRGDVATAHAATEHAKRFAEDVGREVERFSAIAALGTLELARGNPDAAQRLFTPLLAWHATRRWGLATAALVPDGIEALIASGKVEEARPLLLQLERDGRALASPLVAAIVGRLRGLLLAAEGDLDAAVDAGTNALAEHEGQRWPLEEARALLALGAVQRRNKQRRAAREFLTRAQAAFEELGAATWAESARRQLGRIGGRAPRGRELTLAERRVAELVAEGRSNRDVAAALFITPRTVEWNLTKIYRKLGVRSRAELAYRLATQDQPAENS